MRDEPNATNPPTSILRRKTDSREDSNENRPEEKDQDGTALDENPRDLHSPFGTLKRSATGPLSAGLNVPQSPWAVGSSGTARSSIGTFGSFAMGPSTASNDVDGRSSGFGSLRGESRFKGLLARNSVEDISSPAKKSSAPSLHKLVEVEHDTSRDGHDVLPPNRPGRSDTNPYASNEVPAVDNSAFSNTAQENAGSGVESFVGSSAFGFAPLPLGHQESRMLGDYNQDASSFRMPQSHPGAEGPLSPTAITNPYQSPQADRDEGHEDRAGMPLSQPMIGGPGSRDEPTADAFGNTLRGVNPTVDDRNQPANVGAPGGFGAFAGLGGFPAFGSSPWSNLPSGTPNKERTGFASGFGDTVFGPPDLQGPNSMSLSSNHFLTSPPVSKSSLSDRPGKLGPIRPGGTSDQAGLDEFGNQADFAFRNRATGGPDRAFPWKNEDAPRGTSNNFFGQARHPDEIAQRSRHLLDENSFAEQGTSSAMGPGFGSPPNLIGRSGLLGAMGAAASVPPETAIPLGSAPTQGGDSTAANQLPTAQQRQMVMPDRMRWIYRDPSGTTQGPWSGLEMHDWFKAGFFTAELQVKKLEDAEYEPLAQLVRRIGNSREPFLVPQIGVPHGVAAPSQGNHQWSSPTTSNPVGVPGSSQLGSAQPPFASSFPSFGTTLTAEQQNALERRKQEEQYLMARQKEHLAQQQVLLKQMQLSGAPSSLHQLQHHSSAHSLHSQPSFGSITSPSGYQPSPLQGPIQPPQTSGSFLEGSSRQSQPSQLATEVRGGREDDLSSLLERVSISHGGGAAGPFNAGSFGQVSDTGLSNPQINSMPQDRARLQMEQQQQQQQQQQNQNQNHMQGHSIAVGESQPFDDRLLEFKALRSQMQAEEAQSSQVAGQEDSILERSMGHQIHREQADPQERQPAGREGIAWNKPDVVASSALPPASPESPLPAPSAQRNRQNVAENLVSEPRSQSQTPVDTTPTTSVAPWAEHSSESTKGPSLRQIQEAEARQAAQQEEIAMAARRVQEEQDYAAHPVPPAPGLPSTSNWATGGTSTNAAISASSSVWSKGIATKAASTTSSAAGKKTLAQIQKEEEARKQRQSSAANQQNISNNNVIPSAGKRYADLAGKMSNSNPTAAAAVASVSSAAATVPSGAWTTVGSGGKARVPNAVGSSSQAGVSGKNVGTTMNTASAHGGIPNPHSRSAATTVPANGGVNHPTKAIDDFTKWAKLALAKGLNGNINGEW